MSALNDLIDQIKDPTLKERIKQEVNNLNKQKKFGLVFEEHMPENTPLYDMPIKKGSTVARRSGSIKEIYKVVEIYGNNAICIQKGEESQLSIPLEDLVVVAQFGDPIYPYLKPLDSICNAPDSNLWHTLIAN